LVKKGILIILLLFLVGGLGFAEALGGPLEPLEVVDDIGFQITFDGAVKRVVSLYVGHTENLVAIGAKDRLVAASSGDDPEMVGAVPILGAKPGVEQIVSLKPDLVLTRPMQAQSQEALYDRLRSLGVKVLAIDPPTWEEFPDYIELLSRLVGAPDRAQSTLKAKRLMADRVNTERRMGAVLITNGRTMATCTTDSWAAHIMDLAGLENVAVGVRQVSPGSVIAGFGPERLLASDKNIDVVLLQQGAMNTISAVDFMRDPRFRGMKAVREGKVFDVSEADISRPSLLRLERGAIGDLGKLVTYGR
jgi:iron complex transport system substrate-binding protein